MEWIKASERLPEKTGWYFVRKGSLKENAHKALHHMDVLKLAAGIEGYWSEVYEWLDESTPIPILTPCVELEKEVERLKGLIEKLHSEIAGISPVLWLQFKKQNNL